LCPPGVCQTKIYCNRFNSCAYESQGNSGADQKLARKCLELARGMVQCYGSLPTEAALKFASWIISTLNGIIVKAQKRGKPNELNQEYLWRKFNVLTNYTVR